MDADIERLKKTFSYGSKSYQEIKKTSESKIVEWFWAKNSIYEIEPYYFEEHSSPKGKKLKAEPKNKNYHTQYGIDATGNIIVERDMTTFSDLFYETFYQRNKNSITSFHYTYDPEKEIINCKLHLFAKNKITTSYHFVKKRWSCSKYIYTNNILTSKEQQHYESKSKKTSKRTLFYEYDEFNILNGIRSNDYYWYQRKLKLSFNKLKKEAEKRTFLILKEHINNNIPQSKIYSICLGYDSQNYFPPSISYGLKSERKEWIKQGSDAKWYLWNGAEYENSYDLELNNEDKQLFNTLNQEILMNKKHKIAEKSISMIAIQIKKYLSESDFKTTDNFVVVASDYQNLNLKKNFKLINPNEFNYFKKELP